MTFSFIYVTTIDANIKKHPTRAKQFGDRLPLVIKQTCPRLNDLVRMLFKCYIL